MKQLTRDIDGSQGLCPFSQFDWSNTSRDDHKLFALQTYNPKINVYSMNYGSMDGGPLTQFALTTGTQLYLVGWTTM